MEPGPPPRYSDDGRWWWDGQRWLPATQVAVAGAGSGPLVQHAGFLYRFAAFLIDWVILIIGDIVVLVVFGVLATAIDPPASPSSSSSSPSSGVGGILAWITIVVGNWLYFSLLESSARQATVGKLAMGIRVVDLEGRRVTFARATGRHFAKFLSYAICYVGYVMAAFTARRQALHDLIASTLVVRTRPDHAGQLQPGASTGSSAVIISVVTGLGILFFTSFVVIVILLTMGGQIKNVFSNVVVALNSS